MRIPEKIETNRITIRKFRATDKNRFLEFMRDEVSTRYLMFTEEQKTDEGASELFELILNAYDSESPIFSMAIETHEYGYVGSCGVSQIEDNIWECYYSLNREFLKKGFATESLKTLIDYCFNELQANELRAYMSPDNPDSSRVAERCGMQYMGIQVHPIFKNGRCPKVSGNQILLRSSRA